MDLSIYHETSLYFLLFLLVVGIETYLLAPLDEEPFWLTLFRALFANLVMIFCYLVLALIYRGVHGDFTANNNAGVIMLLITLFLTAIALNYYLKQFFYTSLIPDMEELLVRARKAILWGTCALLLCLGTVSTTGLVKAARQADERAYNGF